MDMTGHDRIISKAVVLSFAVQAKLTPYTTVTCTNAHFQQ